MIFSKKTPNKQDLLKKFKDLVKPEYVVTILLALIITIGSFALLKPKQDSDMLELGAVEVRPKPKPKPNVSRIAKNDFPELEKVSFNTVKKGDSLGSILGNLHIESIEIYSAVKALNKLFKASKLKVGDKIYVYYQEDETPAGTKSMILNKAKVYVSDTVRYEIIRTSTGDFFAKKVEVELFSKLQVKSGQIKNSLYVDAIDAGIPPAIIMEFIRFYSFDLDFQRDIRKGDKFQIFYETYYNSEGEFVKNGDIIFCKFITGGKELANYKYTTTKGSTLYFNEKGSSVKKALLRTPISGARMSSRFGYRKHPILGYNKLHTGIDFAARSGTPIYAAGNGTISFVGWKGGYGKYIKIRHNGRYSTAYAHMSRFAKGMRNGAKVKQRQVIGYVGTTGRSTGPHLHYEVLNRGRPINPRSLKPQSKVTLKGKELDKFKIHKGRIDFILTNAFAEANI